MECLRRFKNVRMFKKVQKCYAGYPGTGMLTICWVKVCDITVIDPSITIDVYFKWGFMECLRGFKNVTLGILALEC